MVGIDVFSESGLRTSQATPFGGGKGCWTSYINNFMQATSNANFTAKRFTKRNIGTIADFVFSRTNRNPEIALFLKSFLKKFIV